MADAVIALVRESAVLADEGSPDQRPLVDLNDLPTGVYVTVGILLLAVVLIAILVVLLNYSACQAKQWLAAGQAARPV